MKRLLLVVAMLVAVPTAYGGLGSGKYYCMPQLQAKEGHKETQDEAGNNYTIPSFDFHRNTRDFKYPGFSNFKVSLDAEFPHFLGPPGGFFPLECKRLLNADGLENVVCQERLYRIQANDGNKSERDIRSPAMFMMREQRKHFPRFTFVYMRVGEQQGWDSEWSTIYYAGNCIRERSAPCKGGCG